MQHTSNSHVTPFLKTMTFTQNSHLVEVFLPQTLSRLLSFVLNYAIMQTLAVVHKFTTDSPSLA